MIVVSDTSVINNLASIGHLDLLRQLYETILIPYAVYSELTEPSLSSGGKEAKNYSWIQVSQVEDRDAVQSFLRVLDSGEAEAIALAKELNATQILIDERTAREFAREQGLAVIGILGILAIAKKNALIDEVRPLVVSLRTQSNFWVSEALCTRVLQSVDEGKL